MYFISEKNKMKILATVTVFDDAIYCESKSAKCLYLVGYYDNGETAVYNQCRLFFELLKPDFIKNKHQYAEKCPACLAAEHLHDA